MEVLYIIFLAITLLVTVPSLITHIGRQAGARRAKKDFFAEAKPVRSLRGGERDALQRAFKAEPLDDAVYLLEGDATRHGITTNGNTEWHLLVGGVEIRFFPHWQLWLEENNRVEVIRPKRKLVAKGFGVLPLTFNGMSLADALEHKADDKGVEMRLAEIDSDDSSRVAVGLMDEEGRSGEGFPDAKVTGTYKETPEQARLRQASKQSGVGVSLLLGVGMLGLTLSALLPDTAQWVLGVPLLALTAWSAWRLLQPARATNPSEIRRLSGPLGIRRRSVGKDSDPTLVTEFCVGDTAVHYPPAWREVMLHRPEAMHRVDIDSKNQVVKHDRLDLYEQLRRFPQPQMARYWAQGIGAAVVLVAALWVGSSVGKPIRVTLNRVLGHTQKISARAPAALLDADVQAGDWVELAGTGVCIGGSEDVDIHSLKGLSQQEVPACQVLAWTPEVATAGDIVLLDAVQTLAQLSSDLKQANDRSSTRLANKPRVRALMALFARVPLKHINALVEDVDALCSKIPHDERPCHAVQAAFQKLTGHSGAWGEVVGLAAQGKLKDSMAISARDADILADRLDRAMKSAYLGAQLSLLKTARAAHPASLFLANQGGNRWSHASGHRQLLNSLDDAGAGLAAPIDAMMAWPFTISGVVRQVGARDGKPVLTIERMDRRASVFALAVPWLLGLSGLALLLLAAFKLYRGSDAKIKCKRDVEAYVASHLK